MISYPGGVLSVVRDCGLWRIKWQVGRDYAVSPGRGKPGVWLSSTGEIHLPQYDPLPQPWHDGSVQKTLEARGYKPLRIRITTIRRERVQEITPDDAGREGYPFEFPPTGPVTNPHQVDRVRWYADLWDTINTRKGTRWADSPEVWALSFEVVK